MELGHAAIPDRRVSPGLTLNLSSNNPFRNRSASPAGPSPALPSPQSAPALNRPVSRNPFLAAFEEDRTSRSSMAPSDPPVLVDMSVTMAESPKKSTFGPAAEELFKDLSLNEKPAQDGRRPTPRAGAPPSSRHRPTRSDEDEKKGREGQRGPPKVRPPGARRPVDSPERSENRRPRRNSESSVMDKSSLTEEEQKRRERRKERETRDRKERKPSSTKPRRPNGLDLIDRLDATGIYGPALFHHDGPFDACNPHRNRKKDHRAPMQAFPAGSANNAIGGSGPLNKNIDLDRFRGHGVDAYNDFGTVGEYHDGGAKKRPSVDRSLSFNPKERVELVHGEESLGLGSSTFLEGAPASRNDIQRHETENETAALQNGSIARKKSLAQRIRGMSNQRRAFGDGGPKIASPLSYNGATSPDSIAVRSPQSAGGNLKMQERNPFFDEYDAAYDKKGASIKASEVESDKPGHSRVPSSPLRGSGLERRVTTEANIEPVDGAKSSSGGFLSRVKSLKGGRRARPERRPS